MPLAHRIGRRVAHLVQRLGQPFLAFVHSEQHWQRRRLQAAPRHLAQLRQIDVAQDRLLQLDQVGVPRRLLQQISLAPQVRVQRRHQLFEVGVQRRVGDLGEELPEIVVQELRLVREARQRRVGSHRPQALLPVLGHGGEQDLHVLVGVAEGVLADEQRVVVGLVDMAGGRQVVQVDQVLLEPLAPRALVHQLLLDLPVVDDPPLLHVDQEDLARLEPPLLQHLLRLDRQHADLAGHDHQIVLGDVVAAGPQAVAVEHRADQVPVGERDRCGAVPRLHQAGVVFVERLEVRVHQVVFLPRLRDQHQHRVRQRPAVDREELERVVERGRVGARLRQDRVHFLQLVAEHVALERAVAGSHPVAVAPQGVDLAVVGQVAVGVGQPPRREGVRAEARVDDGQGALEVGVVQVLVVMAELVGRQHPLVDHPVGREDADIKVLPRLLRQIGRELDDVLRPLPDQVQSPIKVRPVEKGLAHPDETLADARLGLARRGAGKPAVHRHVAPAQHHHPVVPHHLLEHLLALVPRHHLLRQKHHPHRVLPLRRQLDPQLGRLLAEKLVRRAEHDPRPVPAVRLAPARPPVAHVLQHQQGVGNDLVRRLTLDVADEADATGVMLAGGVVQPLLGRKALHQRLLRLPGTRLVARSTVIGTVHSSQFYGGDNRKLGDATFRQRLQSTPRPGRSRGSHWVVPDRIRCSTPIDTRRRGGAAATRRGRRKCRRRRNTAARAASPASAR